ncbi:hypothetical protein [Lichenifustis flavocetrariae]|uniref:Uncharacterized protein n=1 Tax=Lichenifustis flavocetrariae TaxID=2949735 RepID=A0AA42CL94_9HYPH|nr:hypothetical protein [Lichenifustis flavocetrariae]MCW6507070.1 hypothetical protein [Lichenifustis flavocetrariae]
MKPKHIEDRFPGISLTMLPKETGRDQSWIVRVASERQIYQCGIDVIRGRAKVYEYYGRMVPEEAQRAVLDAAGVEAISEIVLNGEDAFA